MTKTICVNCDKKGVQEIKKWSEFFRGSNIILKNCALWKLRKVKKLKEIKYLDRSTSQELFSIRDDAIMTGEVSAKDDLCLYYWIFFNLFYIKIPCSADTALFTIISAKVSQKIETQDINLSNSYCIHLKIKYIKDFVVVFRNLNRSNFNIKPLFFLFTLFNFLISFICLFTGKDDKRSILSFNVGSAEYINARDRLRYCSLRVLADVCFHRNFTYYWLFSSNQVIDGISAFWLGRLELVPYCYIGLPGARFVKRIVYAIQNSVITIHLSHGRVSSDKFLTYTDYVITDVTDNFNTKYIKKYKDRVMILYSSKKACWVHGYKKGHGYGWSLLYHDLGLLSDILNSSNVAELTIYPHPTAKLFYLYAKQRALFDQRLIVKRLQKNELLRCSVMYSSSPTFEKYYLENRTKKYIDKEVYFCKLQRYKNEN